MVWRSARALGTTGARWAWNDQFRKGRWELLRGRDRTLVFLVETLAGGHAVVELGCGEGILIEAIDPDTYGSYLGVDLSEVAIESAIRRAGRAELSNCRFEVGDFEQWSGSEAVSLIIMEESLYYLRPRRQQRLVERCLGRLRSGGFMIVTVHSATRHHTTLEICRRVAVVEQEIRDAERVILTLRSRDTSTDRCDCR